VVGFFYNGQKITTREWEIKSRLGRGKISLQLLVAKALLERTNKKAIGSWRGVFFLISAKVHNIDQSSEIIIQQF